MLQRQPETMPGVALSYVIQFPEKRKTDRPTMYKTTCQTYWHAQTPSTVSGPDAV
ncbi:hypothetical protein [Spirosoma agri]|uniref:Uncharacterized protein n=1 Tax=Spirosoma agri TaxID=1987381 RepID=A0A6M0IRE3_9BACT|nr:hypothetical protein [Spirosoma agri]NEU70850.1 hypothetical protein [Spirosoma agri]